MTTLSEALSFLPRAYLTFDTGKFMHEVTGLRLLRILRGQTLANVAKSLKCQRGHLSEVEHDPTAAGRILKQKLEAYHQAPWSLLGRTVDASKIADAIVRTSQTKGTSNATK
jgi:hypothetical protein